MNAISKKIDSYAHIGLPRFVTVEEMLEAMDENGISQAVVAGADTCPDLGEVSRAIVEHGDRFRAVGVPLGNSVEEIGESIEHQAACGFLGIRIFDRMIAAHPTLLRLIGELGLIPWVVGGPALMPAAKLLVEYLEADLDHQVVAPHFAGAADPSWLDSPGPVGDLFDHPRFRVIFSRHGAYDPQYLQPWAEKLVNRLGWERILYGSEFPVCVWRNESYANTQEWVKKLQAPFSLTQQDAFYGANAAQIFWDRPVQAARLVDAKYHPDHWPTPDNVPLFPQQGIEVPVELQRKLLAHYLASGKGEKMDYRTYVTQVLRENLPLFPLK